MSEYWEKRMASSQARITNKSVRAIRAQQKKYYAAAMERTINDFEATYNKLLASMADGREPTVADLYKLDTYWKMQAQLRQELENLGDKQISLMSKEFEKQWRAVYESILLPTSSTYSTIDNSTIKQLINEVWVADGKNFSARVWDNTDKLVKSLNDELVHCVVTGKKPTELKQLLQERFNVSYSRADTIVRTETAHIQTQAAQQRYKDSGITQVEVWADEDERSCDECGALHKERYSIDDPLPIPAHPNCRCCILPVVESF
jgi:SPP1 gp7 family putative phage head morphogenesis protein